MSTASAAGFHHVELWVPDLEAAALTWGWLLGRLGWTEFRAWPGGRSWRSGSDPADAYLCIEHSRDLVLDGPPNRRRVGLNHLALHAGAPADLDALVDLAPSRGWTLMFSDRHPYAGGPGTYAAYLENGDGFEVELVAEVSQVRRVTL